MYTVLWIQGTNDRWDRLESRDAVLDLLEKLKSDPDVCEDDVWIFGPIADDHAWGGYDEFVNANAESW